MVKLAHMTLGEDRFPDYRNETLYLKPDGSYSLECLGGPKSPYPSIPLLERDLFDEDSATSSIRMSEDEAREWAAWWGLDLDHLIHVGNRLKWIRESRRYSRRELAEKTGVSAKSIEAYEYGRKELRKASYESVLALAEALFVKPEDLFYY